MRHNEQMERQTLCQKDYDYVFVFRHANETASLPAPPKMDHNSQLFKVPLVFVVWRLLANYLEKKASFF
jgi:hypothetical protein